MCKILFQKHKSLEYPTDKPNDLKQLKKIKSEENFVINQENSGSSVKKEEEILKKLNVTEQQLEELKEDLKKNQLECNKIILEISSPSTELLKLSQKMSRLSKKTWEIQELYQKLLSKREDLKKQLKKLQNE